MGTVPSTCVLRIALAGPTPDETEAFHRGGRETTWPRSHVMKKPRGSHVGNLTSPLLMCSRFSLQRG
jgi:hypothetical protein